MRVIVAAETELAGADACVGLFGSRLDDSLQGGDIDLPVECAHPVDRPVWLAARLTARLQRILGDRKIDVLVVDPSTPLEPVRRAACATGVRFKACDDYVGACKLV